VDIEKGRMIAGEILQEAINASQIHQPFHSAHEGLAVLQEEYEELKTEVFKERSYRPYGRMREEALQVGAMALRFIYDVCK